MWPSTLVRQLLRTSELLPVLPFLDYPNLSTLCSPHSQDTPFPPTCFPYSLLHERHPGLCRSLSTPSSFWALSLVLNLCASPVCLDPKGPLKWETALELCPAGTTQSPTRSLLADITLKPFSGPPLSPLPHSSLPQIPPPLLHQVGQARRTGRGTRVGLG